MDPTGPDHPGSGPAATHHGRRARPGAGSAACDDRSPTTRPCGSCGGTSSRPSPITCTECNEQGKDLIGLDQHQVRTWTAFHHHVAVCMFAHAFAATRAATFAATLRVSTDPDPDTAATVPATAPREGGHRGNDLVRSGPAGGSLTTVADAVTLLGVRLQSARDLLATIRWTLWKQAHRLRAQTSHY